MPERATDGQERAGRPTIEHLAWLVAAAAGLFYLCRDTSISRRSPSRPQPPIVIQSFTPRPPPRIERVGVPLEKVMESNGLTGKTIPFRYWTPRPEWADDPSRRP